MKKRILMGLLILCILPALVYINASAAIPTSGSCGLSAKWAFNESTGVLTINGSGNVATYPWYLHKNKIKSVVIADGITSICDFAFYDHESLVSVSIPESITRIGGQAFQECGSLTNISLPQNLVSIGYGTFYKCTGLTGIEIPQGVTSIGDQAFQECTGLGSLTIPKNVAEIGDSAFCGCTGLKKLTVGEGVSHIGEQAFRQCKKLSRVSIPQSVGKIGGYAFQECESLSSLSLPQDLTSISDGAFWSCTSLGSVELPQSLTRIGNSAFAECGALAGIAIPDGVITIGSNAFWKCTNLASVSIPKSIAMIEKSAFSECGKLSHVYYAGNESDWLAVKVSSPNAPLTKLMHYNSTGGQTAGSGSVSGTAYLTAYASTQSVNIDGKPVSFRMYALKDSTGNPTNYIKARDLASVLNGTAAQFNVKYDGSVNLLPGEEYVPNGTEMTTPYSGDRPCRKAPDTTLVNGGKAGLDAIILTDDSGGGYTYYKLRDLGGALGFEVGWSMEEGIFINSELAV